MDTQQEEGRPRRYRSRSLRYEKRADPSFSGKWVQEHKVGVTNEEFAGSCRKYDRSITSHILSKILRDDPRYIKCVGNLVARHRVLAMMKALKDLGTVTTREEPYDYLSRLPNGFIDDENLRFLDEEFAKLFPDQSVATLHTDREPGVAMRPQALQQKMEHLSALVEEISRDAGRVYEMDALEQKEMHDLGLQLSDLGLEILKKYSP